MQEASRRWPMCRHVTTAMCREQQRHEAAQSLEERKKAHATLPAVSQTPVRPMVWILGDVSLALVIPLP